MTLSKHHYKDIPAPENLDFDEASLFWRLRLGEGMPNRSWHKPLDRQKSWEKVKWSLDKKLASSRAHNIFHETFPIKSWFHNLLITLKKACLPGLRG
ncbi:MAG: hypothetical protein K940chlam9_00647 [Chlamydiae bacterium]|nr:hypothetical protein [Chlamydiota bacterium]